MNARRLAPASVAKARERVRAAVRASALGPRVDGWLAGQHSRDFDRVLARRRHGPVAADLLYRTLLGRPATRQEQAIFRRRAAGGEPVMELVHELRSTPEASRIAVHRINDALRRYVDPQFDTGTGLSEQPRLVFLHFMKVGGTSVSDRLAEWFPQDRAQVHLYLDDIALSPAPVLANLRVIAGHIPVAGLDLIPPPFTTMAVLREPVSRTLSHWRHLRSVNPAYAALTLDEFVHDERYQQSRNYQARQLAFDMDVVTAWRRFSPQHIVVSEGADPSYPHPLAAVFDSRPLDMTDEQLLERAKAGLARIDHLGTTDRLDDLVEVAARLFGHPHVPVGHLNRSPPAASEQVPDALRRRIEQQTAVDRELYDLVAGQRREPTAAPSDCSTGG